MPVSHLAFLAVVVGLCVRPAAAQSLGLDHIPVAVNNLGQASDVFRRLGFVLKPGRFHANGIQNAHIKFPNGAGLELITAPAPVDDLTAHYTGVMAAGDGPAYVSFHSRDTRKLAEALTAGGYEFEQQGPITRVPAFEYLFFLRDNRSPTDSPEHFAHPNGSTALKAVWLAPEDGDSLAALLVSLGGQRSTRRVMVPDAIMATVVALDDGEVYILPPEHQIIRGRPVIGASFSVSDVSKVREALTQASIAPWQDAEVADRVVVAPGRSHGLWLEFRE